MGCKQRAPSLPPSLPRGHHGSRDACSQATQAVLRLLSFSLRSFFGVEGNPLSVFYSVFVALWSLYFLIKWERRQCELQFLWGVEAAPLAPRPLPLCPAT